MGSDSTSRVFGIGKKSAFQKLAKGGPFLKSCANACITHDKNHNDIETLGSQVIDALFGGGQTCSLAALMYDVFSRKVVPAKSFFIPEHLPQLSLHLSSIARVCTSIP